MPTSAHQVVAFWLVLCTLLGTCSAHNGAETVCHDNVTCKKAEQAEEDASLIQVARLEEDNARTEIGHPARQGWVSFGLKSKPFVGFMGGLLPGAEMGMLRIEEDGLLRTYYLPGATTLHEGKTVLYKPPFRFYLMKRPTTDYSNPENFYRPQLLGKTFSVDVDFSREAASCGCNLRFLLVDMPVHVTGENKDNYCDADCLPGLSCCSEFDMLDGNIEIHRVSSHACRLQHNWDPRKPVMCEKGHTVEVSTHDGYGSFGSGVQNTVDSKAPYTFSQRFDEHNGDITVTTTISQKDRKLVMRMGPDSAGLNLMQEALEKGMALVSGYWFVGEGKDGQQCGIGPKHCLRHPAYVSNWRISTNSDHVGAPSPPMPHRPGHVVQPPAGPHGPAQVDPWIR